MYTCVCSDGSRKRRRSGTSIGPRVVANPACPRQSRFHHARRHAYWLRGAARRVFYDLLRGCLFFNRNHLSTLLRQTDPAAFKIRDHLREARVLLTQLIALHANAKVLLLIDLHGRSDIRNGLQGTVELRLQQPRLIFERGGLLAVGVASSFPREPRRRSGRRSRRSRSVNRPLNVPLLARQGTNPRRE